MRYLMLLAAVAALGLPACSHDDSSDQADQGPSSDVRAQMQHMRDDARTASLNDLSADHRTAVSAVVDQFNGGSLSMEDAAKKIDGILTPGESTAVLGEQRKMREAIRAAAAQNGGGNGFGGRGLGGQ